MFTFSPLTEYALLPLSSPSQHCGVFFQRGPAELWPVTDASSPSTLSPPRFHSSEVFYD